MRQLAYVFDLNKCIGCHTCTMACKQLWTNRDGREYMYWNNVETRPGKGYPKDWEQKGGGFDRDGKLKTDGIIPIRADYGGTWEYNLQEVLLEGKGNQVVPHEKPTWGPNWDEDEGKGEFPNNYYFYLPRICNHCSNPACLAACPRKAIYKLVEQWKVALPLHAEYGTQPNVFYVPPMNTTPPPFEEDGRLGDKPRIPIADIEALFGPRTKEALETLGREMQKRRQAQPSELTEILIGYTNKDRYRI